eukprot:g8674.t1
MNAASTETNAADSVQRTTTLFNPVILSILCGILSFLFYFLHRRSSRRRQNTVLIIGPACSGKTSLFRKVHFSFSSLFNCCQLTGKGFKETYMASLVPEVGVSKANDALRTQFQVVDIPGYPHFSRYLHEYIKKTKMIVFVISGPDFLHDLKNIAQKMWEVVDDVVFKTRQIPLLIAVNKTDVIEHSPSEKFILTQLQNEINKIVRTNPIRLYVMGQFTFTTVKSEVAITKLSIKLDQLQALYQFINKHL